MAYIQATDIVVSSNNPRRITDADKARLRESLESDPDFLKRRPVLVNKINGKYVVFGGTQRFLTLKSIGIVDIPCFVEEGLPKEEFDRRMLLDNTHYGHWDFEAVDEHFSDFVFEDMDLPTAKDLHGDPSFVTVDASKTRPSVHMLEVEFPSQESYGLFLANLEMLSDEYPSLSIVGRLEAGLRARYADLLKV